MIPATPATGSVRPRLRWIEGDRWMLAASVAGIAGLLAYRAGELLIPAALLYWGAHRYGRVSRCILVALLAFTACASVYPYALDFVVTLSGTKFTGPSSPNLYGAAFFVVSLWCLMAPAVDLRNSAMRRARADRLKSPPTGATESQSVQSRANLG